MEDSAPPQENEPGALAPQDFPPPEPAALPIIVCENPTETLEVRPDASSRENKEPPSPLPPPPLSQEAASTHSKSHRPTPKPQVVQPPPRVPAQLAPQPAVVTATAPRFDFAGTSRRLLVRVLRALRLTPVEGGPHTKFVDDAGHVVTTVPRHAQLKPCLVGLIGRQVIAHLAKDT